MNITAQTRPNKLTPTKSREALFTVVRADTGRIYCPHLRELQQCCHFLAADEKLVLDNPLRYGNPPDQFYLLNLVNQDPARLSVYTLDLNLSDRLAAEISQQPDRSKQSELLLRKFNKFLDNTSFNDGKKPIHIAMVFVAAQTISRDTSLDPMHIPAAHCHGFIVATASQAEIIDKRLSNKQSEFFRATVGGGLHNYYHHQRIKDYRKPLDIGLSDYIARQEGWLTVPVAVSKALRGEFNTFRHNLRDADYRRSYEAYEDIQIGTIPKPIRDTLRQLAGVAFRRKYGEVFLPYGCTAEKVITVLDTYI